VCGEYLPSCHPLPPGIYEHTPRYHLSAFPLREIFLVPSDVASSIPCKALAHNSLTPHLKEYRNDLHQISHLYLATLIEDTGVPELTDLEKSEGPTHHWVKVERVLDLMNSVVPTSNLGKSIQKRDVWFVETWLNSKEDVVTIETSVGKKSN
jgi:hypothetical protein